jgi:hypothetical protein
MKIEVKACVDQRTVLCERHTGDGEANAGAQESKRSIRGEVVEGVLPGGRGIRRKAMSCMCMVLEIAPVI